MYLVSINKVIRGVIVEHHSAVKRYTEKNQAGNACQITGPLTIFAPCGNMRCKVYLLYLRYLKASCTIKFVCILDFMLIWMGILDLSKVRAWQRRRGRYHSMHEYLILQEKTTNISGINFKFLLGSVFWFCYFSNYTWFYLNNFGSHLRNYCLFVFVKHNWFVTSFHKCDPWHEKVNLN